MLTSDTGACEKKDPEIPELLINHGANIEETELYGFTPLHLSSFLGNEKVVRLLLDKGARVNSTTKVGATPLHLGKGYSNPTDKLACKNNQLETAKLLIQHGADTTIKDEKGATPFEVSKSSDFIQTLKGKIFNRGVNCRFYKR